MPDTVGLSTQSLGSQPEYYHVYWGGGKWIEMHGYRSAWPHCVRVAPAQRFVCAERSGVIFFFFSLSLSFFFFYFSGKCCTLTPFNKTGMWTVQQKKKLAIRRPLSQTGKMNITEHLSSQIQRELLLNLMVSWSTCSCSYQWRCRLGSKLTGRF